jgi:cysteine desulfurase family protein
MCFKGVLMIYLDNSATTHNKPFMVKFMNLLYLQRYSANAGRSGHNLSIKCLNKVLECRERLHNFYNNDCLEKVIFTGSCTEALNLAILGTAKKGGHIITTYLEHNSVLRAVTSLNEEYTLLDFDENGKINLEELEKSIKNNTYIVIINHESNVIGSDQDLENIGKICKKHNLLFLVDSAQSSGHIKIDMQKCNISMLAFAGHKGLLSSQGIGGLIVNGDVPLHPIKFGGTGTDSLNIYEPTSYPEGFEAGTLPTPLIAGLNEGVKYVDKHFDKINNRIKNLSKFLIDKLLEINKIDLLTPKNCYNGVISFNIIGINSSEVSNYLNEKYNIATRSGLQCAPLIHKHFKTEEQGAVRVSIGYKNNKRQIKKLIYAIKKYIKEC